MDRTEAVRVFHGGGDAGPGWMEQVAVDRFGEHFWVTHWGEPGQPRVQESDRESIVEFLRERGAQSVVGMDRPPKGLPGTPELWWGRCPLARFEVREGRARFWVQLQGVRHPGLFLDHIELRQWLMEHARGWAVLNTFAYTCSLSIACGLGDAAHVVSLDLSKPSLEWGLENWRLNDLREMKADWIYGDTFEWLPRMKRDGRLFDCVILDPPSFSRAPKGKSAKKSTFSTSKDLAELHALALDVLKPGGVLVTSINSANVSVRKYEQDIADAARARKRTIQVLRTLEQPETFPTAVGGSPEARYLKGWILRC